MNIIKTHMITFGKNSLSIAKEQQMRLGQVPEFARRRRAELGIQIDVEKSSKGVKDRKIDGFSPSHRNEGKPDPYGENIRGFEGGFDVAGYDGECICRILRPVCARTFWCSTVASRRCFGTNPVAT